LRNFVAQERVLLRLMDRARSIRDTIEVERELQGVQLQVERIRGRLRYLKNQSALGTITVSLAVAGVPPPQPPGILARAWQRAVATFLAVVSGVIIASGFVLPVALLVGAAFAGFKLLWPRLIS
jgi:Domain of unknown function (DUF4349)